MWQGRAGVANASISDGRKGVGEGSFFSFTKILWQLLLGDSYLPAPKAHLVRQPRRRSCARVVPGRCFCSFRSFLGCLSRPGLRRAEPESLPVQAPSPRPGPNPSPFHHHQQSLPAKLPNSHAEGPQARSLGPFTSGFSHFGLTKLQRMH